MTLFEYPAKVPNGEIKPGDVVYVNYWGYQSFSRVWEEDGYIMIRGAGAMCFNITAAHFLKSGGELKKVTPKDVYIFCKTNRCDTSKYLALFKKK